MSHDRTFLRGLQCLSLRLLQLMLFLLAAAVLAALVVFAVYTHRPTASIVHVLRLAQESTTLDNRKINWNAAPWKNLSKPYRVSDAVWKEYVFHYEYRGLLEEQSQNDRNNTNSYGTPPVCPQMAPFLVGHIRLASYVAPLAELEALDFFVEPGGRFAPGHCISRTNVAIIIPFRNRWEHLAVWLLHMHPFLQKQELNYTVYVVNQAEGSKFNRGILLNIGFTEAQRMSSLDCLIFHDVDLLPVVDRNIYNCSDLPKHMSVAIDKFDYQLPYNRLIGGVLAIKREQFEKLNGYSNFYFGWGGEDDDFSKRIILSGLTIDRPHPHVGRYKMFKHLRDAGNEPNPMRFQLLRGSSSRFSEDGLNSLVYMLKEVRLDSLYTFIDVAVDESHYYGIVTGFFAVPPVTASTSKRGAQTNTTGP